MKKELAEYTGTDESEIKVIATGGLSTLVQSGTECLDVIDKRLTLDGLVIIYEKNKATRKKKTK